MSLKKLYRRPHYFSGKHSICTGTNHQVIYHWCNGYPRLGVGRGYSHGAQFIVATLPQCKCKAHWNSNLSVILFTAKDWVHFDSELWIYFFRLAWDYVYSYKRQVSRVSWGSFPQAGDQLDTQWPDDLTSLVDIIEALKMQTLVGIVPSSELQLL